MAKMFGAEIVKVDLSKSKRGWINPFTGESNLTEELKEKAKKAIKSRKYKKAYRLLRKIKKLTSNTIQCRCYEINRKRIKFFKRIPIKTS